MKKWHLPFLVLLIVGTYLAYLQKHPTARYIKEEMQVFGTVMHVTYKTTASLREGYSEELRQVDMSLSMFNPMSTLSRINRNETDTADAMLQEVLRMAMAVSEATDGAFDVTVAPLVNAWGFGFKNGQLPDSVQVDSLLTLVGYRNIALTEDGRVEKKYPGIVMDLSAIAKGYGVDKVAEYLKANGVTDYMVEIGGEVACQGRNAKGKAWRIGINKPDDDPTSTNTDIEKVIELEDGAMATSGNYRNYYVTPEGKRIMHTIDPKTGYPVQHNVLSATVIAPTCAMADAFATSFMVMGSERAEEVLKQHPELKAELICTEE
jgi:thiamine biosynthesis lipoprotein